MITRRTPLKRSKPIPRKRAKPRRTTMLRDPRYRAFLRSDVACEICSAIHARKYDHLSIEGLREAWKVMATIGYCDPCHTENGGMRMKGPDSSCAPLCRIHHEQFDGRAKLPNGKVGRVAFETYYRVDMKAVAKSWWELYQEKKV